MFDLTLKPSEASTLRNALVVAAERFDEHAALFKVEAEKAPHWDRISEQFTRQAAETRALLTKLAEAEYGPEEDA